MDSLQTIRLATIDPNADTVDDDPQPSPRPRRPLGQLLLDHNPLFLLSGVSMLLGCYLINASIHDEQLRSGGLGTGLGVLLALLAVFNLYELLVVGLGVYLLRSRMLVRDAGYLLVLEVLLLADVALVYNEIATQDFTLGVGVAIVLGGLAIAKIGAIAWGVGLHLSRGAWILIAADIAAVLAAPLVPRGLSIGSDWELLPRSTFLWCFWGVGLLIAAHALPARWLVRSGSKHLVALRRGLVVALAGVPILSLLGHVWGAAWVYEHDVHAAYFSPVILGSLVFFVRWAPGRVQVETARAAVVMGGLAAVLLSFAFPESLAGSAGPIDVSPLRAGLFGAAAVCGWAWWRLGGGAFLVLAGGATGLALLGSTPRVMRDRLSQGAETFGELIGWTESILRSAGDTGAQAVPSTTLGWGIVAVAVAFALLVAGGCVSLIRRPRKTE